MMASWLVAASVVMGCLSRCAGCRRAASDYPAAFLVQLDGFEQRLEIALAEAVVALALDELEEDRPDHVGGEDLQQEAAALVLAAVDEDAALAQRLDVLAVAGQALVDELSR